MLEPSWTVQGSTPGQPLGSWILLYPAQKAGDRNSGCWKRNSIIRHHPAPHSVHRRCEGTKKGKEFCALWSVKYHMSMALKVDMIRSWWALVVDFKFHFGSFIVKIPEKGFFPSYHPSKCEFPKTPYLNSRGGKRCSEKAPRWQRTVGLIWKRIDKLCYKGNDVEYPILYIC